jgi:hypothetical protein
VWSFEIQDFEDARAVASMPIFFGSFGLTGTDSPIQKAEGRARFPKFTEQFILREYETLNPKDIFAAG